jgi:hypothetical protein
MIKDIFLYQNKHKQEKKNYKKILEKYNIEYDLIPECIKKNLDLSTTLKDYENNVRKYIRYDKLKKLLDINGLGEHIDLKICTSYIDNCEDNKNYFVYISNHKQKKVYFDEMPQLILFILNKKKILEQAIKNNNFPENKYQKIFEKFINTLDNDEVEANKIKKNIYNDIDLLIEHIKKIEISQSINNNNDVEI